MSKYASNHCNLLSTLKNMQAFRVAPCTLICRGAFDFKWQLLSITVWLLQIFLKTLVSHFLFKRFYSLLVIVRVVLKMAVVRLIEVTDTLTAWLEIIIKARQGIICQSGIKSGQLFFFTYIFPEQPSGNKREREVCLFCRSQMWQGD